MYVAFILHTLPSVGNIQLVILISDILRSCNYTTALWARSSTGIYLRIMVCWQWLFVVTEHENSSTTSNVLKSSHKPRVVPSSIV